MRKYGQAIWSLQLLLISEGDTEAIAQGKINDLRNDLDAQDNLCVFQYTASKPQQLFDCINASILVWMDVSKKSFLITELS